MTRPSVWFIIAFLLFSLIFYFNTYKIWFKTDSYYEELLNSLNQQSVQYPFRDFFIRRAQNKKRWVLEQKIFSLVGLVAVIVADVLVIAAWMS